MQPLQPLSLASQIRDKTNPLPSFYNPPLQRNAMPFSMRSVKSIFIPFSGSTSVNLYPSPSITPSDATVVDVNPVAERDSLSQGFGTISFQAKPPRTRRREPSFTYVTIPSIPGVSITERRVRDTTIDSMSNFSIGFEFKATQIQIHLASQRGLQA